MKSRIPPCRICNRVNPEHFLLEWTQAWEECETCRYPCYKCQRSGADHVPEECWIIGDHRQTRQDLLQGLEERAKQIEFCLEGNQSPLCSKSLLHNRHTLENCLEDYSRVLEDTETQAIPEVQATWKIYEGDIEVTQIKNKPLSGLRECGFCKQKRPLHYPKECLREGPLCHPCLFCRKEGPDHIPEHCPDKDRETEDRDVNILFQQRIQFQ